MVNDLPLLEHFWLICAAWVGVGGGLYYWFALTRERNSQSFTKEQAFRYSRNYALAIIIPSLVFWLIQTTLPDASSPVLFEWPAPQKYFAVGAVVTCWVLLIAWVNFWGGAEITSRVLRAVNPKQSDFFTSETAIRVLSVLVVAAGFLAMWMAENAR